MRIPAAGADPPSRSFGRRRPAGVPENDAGAAAAAGVRRPGHDAARRADRSRNDSAERSRWRLCSAGVRPPNGRCPGSTGMHGARGTERPRQPRRHAGPCRSRSCGAGPRVAGTEHVSDNARNRMTPGIAPISIRSRETDPARRCWQRPRISPFQRRPNHFERSRKTPNRSCRQRRRRMVRLPPRPTFIEIDSGNTVAGSVRTVVGGAVRTAGPGRPTAPAERRGLVRQAS